MRRDAPCTGTFGKFRTRILVKIQTGFRKFGTVVVRGTAAAQVHSVSNQLFRIEFPLRNILQFGNAQIVIEMRFKLIQGMSHTENLLGMRKVRVQILNVDSLINRMRCLESILNQRRLLITTTKFLRSTCKVLRTRIMASVMVQELCDISL